MLEQCKECKHKESCEMTFGDGKQQLESKLNTIYSHWADLDFVSKKYYKTPNNFGLSLNIKCLGFEKGYSTKELFIMFKHYMNNYSFLDYKPYPFLENSLITWYKGIGEVAVQFDPKTEKFNLIPNAMKYEKILEMKGVNHNGTVETPE